VTVTSGGFAAGAVRAGARRLWSGLYATADVDWLRNAAEFRLGQLAALDDLDALNALVARGRGRAGAFDWPAFVRAGLLPGVPTDPAGAAYVRWIAATFPADGVEPRAVDVLNHAMRAWGHVFLYDEPTLRAELARAGFADVTRHALNERDAPALRGPPPRRRCLPATERGAPVRRPPRDQPGPATRSRAAS